MTRREHVNHSMLFFAYAACAAAAVFWVERHNFQLMLMWISGYLCMAGIVIYMLGLRKPR